MKRKDFDPKVYRGKDRVLIGVPRRQNVSRLYVWDSGAAEYKLPPRGKSYYARRQVPGPGGGRRRESEYFETLEEVNAWQAFAAATPTPAPGAMPDEGPTLQAIVDEWRSRTFSALGAGTIEAYEKSLRLWFVHLLCVPVRAITAAVVDRWIDWMKENVDLYGKGKQRQSFKAELALLSTLLGYYAEFHDEDTAFRNPIKRRHRASIRIRNRKLAHRDLGPEDAAKFLEQVGRDRGAVGEAFATVQYWQAHRVSETAALRWEDVRLDFEDPRRSRLFVAQHVVYLRGKHAQSRIEPGFKNGAGIKEQPMLPQVFAALARIRPARPEGLIFRAGNKDRAPAEDFLAYRTLQTWYDRAFKRLGLPYTATHVLRHGGTRSIFELTGGDRDVAKQQLGNRNDRTVEVYAVRSSAAFTQVVNGLWDDALQHPGRKWPQSGGRLEIVKEDQ
jgi:integrase